jgi:hypothetical protein
MFRADGKPCRHPLAWPLLLRTTSRSMASADHQRASYSQTACMTQKFFWLHEGHTHVTVAASVTAGVPSVVSYSRRRILQLTALL